MIYYFSGTGNSRYVAESLADCIGDDAAPLAPLACSDEEVCLSSYESVGIVCPVYSWGLPVPVVEFVRRLARSRDKQPYVWCVLTCGDETGLAHRIMKSELARRGYNLNAVWSVIMPNNYVLLAGFDVDADDVAQRKIDAAPKRIAEIAAGIFERTEVTDVTVGSLPWLKSRIVYPLFKRWGIFPRKFRVSSDCVGCRRCASACPLGNVTMVDGKPSWGNNCASCVACYHVCPRECIQYGSATRGKGHYCFRAKTKGGE
mgnify:CR=1 FL=1